MSSKSEARRLIKNNGLEINNILLDDEKKLLKENDFINKILKNFLRKKNII